MRYDFYAYLDRMKYIKRWQLMRSEREENIMEHSQSVAVIAHALAVIRNEVYGGKADVLKTVLYAMYHETSEVMTGDLPTPVKYYNRSIHGAYKQLEKSACEKITDMLPEELKKGIAPFVLAERTARNTVSSRRRTGFRRISNAWRSCVRATANFRKRKRVLKKTFIHAICPRWNIFSKTLSRPFR